MTIEYPKWKYRGADGVLVHSAEEEAALGDGWADQPSEVSPAPEVDESEALKARIAELEAQLSNKKTTKKE